MSAGEKFVPTPTPTKEILDAWVKEGRPARDSDPVNHPEHYTSHPTGIECIQIVEYMNFCIGNAIKYIWRADRKNGIEDLKKAAWYINREIARRERDGQLG